MTLFGSRRIASVTASPRYPVSDLTIQAGENISVTSVGRTRTIAATGLPSVGDVFVAKNETSSPYAGGALRTIWLEPDAILPGVVTRVDNLNQIRITRNYVVQKIIRLGEIGFRRFIIAYDEKNGRVYTRYPAGVTPINPATGLPLTWWRDTQLPSLFPYIEDFDIIEAYFAGAAQVPGAEVIIGLGRDNDLQMLNDLYSVQVLAAPDPMTFSKTVVQRRDVCVVSGQNRAVNLFSRFGALRCFEGWYSGHETDHVASSAQFYSRLFNVSGTYPALNTYKKADRTPTTCHISPASPIDFANTDVFATACLDCKADVLWPQDSVGYGLNYSTGRDCFSRFVSISGADTHFQTWRAVHDRARHGFKLGLNMDNWAKGESLDMNLTLSLSTVGTGRTFTRTAGAGIWPVGCEGQTINGLGTYATGLATITSRTSDTVVVATITEAFGGTTLNAAFWALVPPLGDAIYDDFPASWTGTAGLLRQMTKEGVWVDPGYISTYGDTFVEPTGLELSPVQTTAGKTDWATRANTLATEIGNFNKAQYLALGGGPAESISRIRPYVVTGGAGTLDTQLTVQIAVIRPTRQAMFNASVTSSFTLAGATGNWTIELLRTDEFSSDAVCTNAYTLPSAFYTGAPVTILDPEWRPETVDQNYRIRLRPEAGATGTPTHVRTVMTLLETV
jgi:hypothetical protein